MPFNNSNAQKLCVVTDGPRTERFRIFTPQTKGSAETRLRVRHISATLFPVHSAARIGAMERHIRRRGSFISDCVHSAHIITQVVRQDRCRYGAFDDNSQASSTASAAGRCTDDERLSFQG